MLQTYFEGRKKSTYILFFVFQIVFIIVQVFVFIPCIRYSNGWIQMVESLVDNDEQEEYTTEQYLSLAPDEDTEVEIQEDPKSTSNINSVLDKISWTSLDQRKTPKWFAESKIGVIINWGPYSVPSFSEYGGPADWFWYYWQNDRYFPPLDKKHKKEYFSMKKHSRHSIDSIQNFAKGKFREYADFVMKFSGELFDPHHWTSVIKKSGAKSVILTSKNHDGFAMWGSKYSWNWNSLDGGPLKDVVGELEKAVRDQGLYYGIYYSLFEWFHPLYTDDKRNEFKTQHYIKARVMPELKELVSAYKPDILWVDGHWEAPCSYWNCTEFLAWLYNESPIKDSVVTNDRWGDDVVCQHGDFFTCDEYYNPDMQYPSENWAWIVTVDKESSGYRRNAELKDYCNMDEMIEILAKTISNGGNILLNIGATSEGLIMPIFEERLDNLGKWLAVNGEAIFDTVPWHTAQDSLNKDIYYTKKIISKEEAIIYAIILQWPKNDWLPIGSPKLDSKTSVIWLGYNGDDHITWEKGPAGFNLKLPQITINEIPCEWAWVLKFSNLTNVFDSYR